MIFALAEGIVRPTIAIATAARVNTVLCPVFDGRGSKKVKIIRDYALATQQNTAVLEKQTAQ